MRDVLYAIAAQVHPDTRALVMVDKIDPTATAAVEEVCARLARLVDVSTSERIAVATPYASYLDDVDLPYPGHAAVLCSQLQDSGANWASGSAYRVSGRLTEKGFIAEHKVVWPAASDAPVPVGRALLCADAIGDVLRAVRGSSRKHRLFARVRPTRHQGAGLTIDVPVFERRIGTGIELDAAGR